MGEQRKEQIIEALLCLASEKGLKGVSMSMIAEKVGIRKASLYNHFKSKEELIDGAYSFLREKAKEKTKTEIRDYDEFLQGKTACEILSGAVMNYVKLTSESKINDFYKVIYSERVYSACASKIMQSETEKMIDETRKLFLLLQNKKLLSFYNVDIGATTFALTVHGITDYIADKTFGKEKTTEDFKILYDFIDIFCREHAFRE